jgi:hypothetical protein
VASNVSDLDKRATCLPRVRQLATDQYRLSKAWRLLVLLEKMACTTKGECRKQRNANHGEMRTATRAKSEFPNHCTDNSFSLGHNTDFPFAITVRLVAFCFSWYGSILPLNNVCNFEPFSSPEYVGLRGGLLVSHTLAQVALR